MIKYVKQLEGIIEGWLKKVPHLPKNAQKWLAENIWWIALIGAVVYGISILVTFSTIFYLQYAIANTSYLVPGFATWTLISAIEAIIFNIAIGVLLAMSVSPLKAMTKKGWTLLFIVFLVNLLALVVGAFISLLQGISFSGTGVFAFTGFIFSLVFGAIFAAVAAYFLFEIRSHFAHVTKGAAKK